VILYRPILKVEGQRKAVPVQAVEAYGEVGIYLHSFLTTSLDSGKVDSFTLRSLYPQGKWSQFPLNKSQQRKSGYLNLLGLKPRFLGHPALSLVSILIRLYQLPRPQNKETE